MVNICGISRSDVVDQVDCDPAALDVISTIREVVYPESRLCKGHSRLTAEGSKNADRDRERRKRERGLFEDLSQYYPVGQRQDKWTRSSLLPVGKYTGVIAQLIVTFHSPESFPVLEDLKNLAPTSPPVAGYQAGSINFDPNAGSSSVT